MVLAVNGNILRPTPDGYYNLQLDAFMHKRLYLLTSQTFDLSLFRGEWYLYRGPAPTVFILPFYLIFGIKASSILYTFLAACGNIALFYLLIKECKKYFHIGLSFFSEIFLVLSFCFASSNLPLGIIGGTWSTSTEQVVAVFYLLLFYLFYFKWLGNIRNVWMLFVAVLFFNLAWLSRYTMIFHGVLFLYPFFIGKFHEKRVALKQFFIIGIFIGVCICGDFLYNYARFNNPFETGLRYHHGSKRYAQVIASHKFFDISYAPGNLYYYFLNIPQFLSHKPFVKIDEEGNSIFVVYPAILLLVFLAKSRYLREQKIKKFLVFAGVVIILTLSVLMVCFATGWVQFGNRYFFDIQPLVYVLLIFVMQDISLFVLIPMLVYEISVNIAGTVNFLHIS